MLSKNKIYIKKKAIFQAWMIEQSRTVEIALLRKILKWKVKRISEKAALFSDCPVAAYRT